MRDEIFKEALKWYDDQNGNPNIEDFVNLIINKTTDKICENIKNELIVEFENGNLQHPFVISSEYYLDLKFKDIKNKYFNKEISKKFSINE